MCTGTTTNSFRSAVFPAESGSCPVVTASDNRFLNERICICGVELRNKKKKTAVLLFFHRPCGTRNCGDETWVTPRLPAAIVVGGPGSFTVTVDALKVDLTKNHEPDKGAELFDVFDVEVIIYTAYE